MADVDRDSCEEVAVALLSDIPFMEKYAKVERLLYGLDTNRLVAFLHSVANRIGQNLQKETRKETSTQLYDSRFYEWVRVGAQRSAAVIVPLLVDLIRPRSVVDVGCGDGTWLAAFREAGVERVRGLDGDWVESRQLAIPATSFRATDLSTFEADVEDRYDLVLSVECAEHLEGRYAEGFVRNLCTMGPVVCFSAAIPFQGGSGHLNEQWPEYWARLFKEFGYDVIDWLRPRIWSNPEVESWYAQNILLFADEAALRSRPTLQKYRDETDSDALTRIHPAHYLKIVMFLLPEVVRQGMT